MANIRPFHAYRYSSRAGPLERLVTQPYDKISPEMQARYLALSPYNFVRIILGERFPSDSESDNVYTRAAASLQDWIARGILQRDPEPCLFTYFQEFAEPDTGEKLTRKGFIGLGPVEEYAAGVVFRHEQTLSGPKKDRLALIRHTRAHLEQLFLLYSDPAGDIDRLLDEAAQAAPLGAVTDEYGAGHSIWRIADPARIGCIQRLMRDKKLLIADGHHRYETALAYRRENPGLRNAANVIMTFVNMHSPGLRILATHRVVSGLAGFEPNEFLKKAAADFNVEETGSIEALRHRWSGSSPAAVIGAAVANKLYALEARAVSGALDVGVLHDVVLAKTLGIGEEAVREEKNLKYVRGIDAALRHVREGNAQIAFLLKPTSVQRVADISFGGGVMPQKSTDFYPKLLSGLTICKLEE